MQNKQTSHTIYSNQTHYSSSSSRNCIVGVHADLICPYWGEPRASPTLAGLHCADVCVYDRPTDRPCLRPYTVNFKCAFKYFPKIELPRSLAWQCAGLLSECSVAAVGNRSGDGSRV